MNNTLGARICTIRNENNMIPSEFARELNTNPTNVTKWEMDEHAPTATMITRICTRFNVNANWLLGITGGKDYIQMGSDRREPPIEDESGRYTNCEFCGTLPSGRRDCRVLTDFYNDGANCRGCTFFKSHNDFEADRGKYPVVNYGETRRKESRPI